MHHAEQIASIEENAPVVAKVTDFGLAAQLYSKFGESRNQSWQWLAPEVLMEQGFTHKSDIYRYACRYPPPSCHCVMT
jgi:serine/threonine protein kinase